MKKKRKSKAFLTAVKEIKERFKHLTSDEIEQKIVNLERKWQKTEEEE